MSGKRASPSEKQQKRQLESASRNQSRLSRKTQSSNKSRIEVPPFLHKLTKALDANSSKYRVSPQLPATRLKSPTAGLSSLEQPYLKNRYSNLSRKPIKVHSIDYYESLINSLDRKKAQKQPPKQQSRLRKPKEKKKAKPRPPEIAATGSSLLTTDIVRYFKEKKKMMYFWCDAAQTCAPT